MLETLVCTTCNSGRAAFGRYKTGVERDPEAVGNLVRNVALALRIDKKGLADVLGDSTVVIRDHLNNEPLLRSNEEMWERALLFLQIAQNLMKVLGGEAEKARLWLRSVDGDKFQVFKNLSELTSES